MKKYTANGYETLTKGQSKKAMKALHRELEEILRTFDYTNYVPTIFFDHTNNTTIIPKPLFAATLVNMEALEWVIEGINEHPGCEIAIV